MLKKIFEKIKLMKNYIYKTFSFMKSFVFYLIYYKPTKAALNYIENYISIENFLNGICERWDEKLLISYFQRLEHHEIDIFEQDNTTIDLVYENLIDGNYISLMLMIMTCKNMRINDYYKFYLLVKDNYLIKNKLYENLNFRKHVLKYIEKSKLKFNENISFKIIFKGNNFNNNINYINYNNNMNTFSCSESHGKRLSLSSQWESGVISCALCFEDINENNFYTRCKICKTEMDISCMNQWIKMDKNSCIMCRKNLLDEKESFNLILLQKYLDYLIISKELDLYRLNEFPS